MDGDSTQPSTPTLPADTPAATTATPEATTSNEISHGVDGSIIDHAPLGHRAVFGVQKEAEEWQRLHTSRGARKGNDTLSYCNSRGS